MKPTEADIKWCIENRDLIARWLEQRGGWQEGDWYKHNDGDEPSLLGRVGIHMAARGSDFATWLPGIGDVLEMLDDDSLDLVLQNLHGEGCTLGPNGEGYLAYLRGHNLYSSAWRRGLGHTRLIALMELLKASKS